MPIFEYRCAACGADFEQLVRAGEEAACPFCESRELERKLSAAAVGGASSLPLHGGGGGGGGCCGGACGCR